ncbi:MAG TPA: cobalamin-binding protein [Gammaproteobacteria bacterium]|nr:cobalamin-binding protein [Gammaproteobacteria bacterium]
MSDAERVLPHFRRLRALAFAACACALGAPVQAASPQRITDDLARQVEVGVPARRVVTLAPHLTELVYAAGAGATLVGADRYSDYPPAARELPRIGDAFQQDAERILALAPDLVLAWGSGTPRAAIDRLAGLGLAVVALEPRGLEDIARQLLLIGELTGHATTAQHAADTYRARLAALRERHAGRAPVKVFYQVSAQPLYTVNGAHTISELLALCGGINVFADLEVLAPVVALEAVLARAPEAIVTGYAAAELDMWRRFPELPAVAHGNLFVIDGSLVARATPRLLEGGERLCAVLEQARRNREERAAGG